MGNYTPCHNRHIVAFLQKEDGNQTLIRSTTVQQEVKPRVQSLLTARSHEEMSI